MSATQVNHAVGTERNLRKTFDHGAGLRQIAHYRAVAVIVDHHPDAAEDGAAVGSIFLRPARFILKRTALQPRDHLVVGHGGRIDIALNMAGAVLLDQVELVLGFDPLGHGLHAQRLGEADDRAHDRAVVVARFGRATHEALVDFDLVERCGAQIAERGIAGAEIVERQPDTDRLELLEHTLGSPGVAEENGFGDLKLEPVGLQPCGLEHSINEGRKIVMDELDRGDIDCDAQRHWPSHRIATHPFQRPVAERLDLVDLLGNRYELAGGNIPLLGVVPAHQSFEARHLVGLDINDRLVVHRHLVLDECVAQILLELASVVGSIFKVARIEPVSAAPVALGGIKRQIGRFDDLFAVETIVRRDRHADGDADDRAQAVDRIGLGQHLNQLAAEIAKDPAVVDIGQHDLELVAPDPADVAHVPDHLLQPRRELLEQFIARGMTQRVVDLLEAVEIEHHQCAALLGIAVGFERLVEPRLHPAAIGQPGQRIELRHPFCIALLLATGGDVLRTATVTGEFPGIVVLWLASNFPEDRLGRALDRDR